MNVYVQLYLYINVQVVTWILANQKKNVILPSLKWNEYEIGVNWKRKKKNLGIVFRL